jgi:hypothetical protein
VEVRRSEAVVGLVIGLMVKGRTRTRHHAINGVMETGRVCALQNETDVRAP